MTSPSGASASASATEETPLVTCDNNNGATNLNNTDNESTRLWEELDAPWPSTFERAVSLLASPVVSKDQVELYTTSPKPGSTPLALQRRRNLQRGFYSPGGTSPQAAALAQRRALEGEQRRAMTLEDAEVGDATRVAKVQALGGRVDATHSKLAAKAQKAKEYRQQFLLQAEQQQQKKTKPRDDGAAHLTDSERETMLRSPGYAKEIQSLRYSKEKAAQQQQQSPSSGAGSATVLQSAFNLANILMGVGLLGLPFGFKVAGYAGGLICTLVFGVITWRTAILIGRELNGDPRPSHTFCDNPFKSPHAPGTAHGRLFPPIQGFPDIAQSFGYSGRVVLSILLYFELFSCVCIFFVAIGDHLHSIFPAVPQETHVIVAATISLVPTIFLHTPRLLSYFSMVGTFATVAVVATVVLAALSQGSQVDKIMKQTQAPPEQEAYRAWGDSQGWILCLGLVAYCFSGHAIVPSIYTSMKEPQRFEEMVTITFAIVMCVCLAVVRDDEIICVNERANGCCVTK